MAKNVVVCCDGTGNEYGDRNTNVLKLYSVLPFNDREQVSFYDPGVGTFSLPGALTVPMKLVTKVFGLAFGLGISQNIADAYQFLMRTYEEGDRVYLFGFSRGAYTARAVAAMLYKVGLLDTRDDNLIPYALKMFKYERRSEITNGFRKIFSRDCPIHFLGLWDTVSSVGWIYDPLTLQFTSQNPSVRTVRHALSIDERRCFFRQNMWETPGAGQDVQQVWFAGSHSDVGGSYPEKESGLSQIALRWMIREAKASGLRIDDQQYGIVVPSDPQPVGVEYHAVPDYAGMAHESLKGPWWIAEFIPKLYRDPRDHFAKKLKIPLGRRRWIPEGSAIDESVAKRLKDQNLMYRPSNIPESCIVRV
jgi:uncharacterized protein (DUF2235 family)